MLTENPDKVYFMHWNLWSLLLALIAPIMTSSKQELLSSDCTRYPQMNNTPAKTVDGVHWPADIFNTLDVENIVNYDWSHSDGYQWHWFRFLSTNEQVRCKPIEWQSWIFSKVALKINKCSFNMLQSMSRYGTAPGISCWYDSAVHMISDASINIG